MKRLIGTCIALLFTHAIGAQAPVKTIEDGALDKIVLFVAALEPPAGLTVAIKPFDASAADLGTGNKDGTEARQEEARTLQNEGPRVLAEHFVATLEKGGPFKAVRTLDADDSLFGEALVVEG
jgi:hypothetical protein